MGRANGLMDPLGEIMSNRHPIHRRDALKLAALGLAGGLPAAAASKTFAVKPSSDPFQGLKLGITSYTTRKLSLDETIAALKRLDISYISIKDFHLAMETTTAERQTVARKVKEGGLTLMGCGVIGLKNDEAQIRHAFDYCKDLGSSTAIIAPTPDAVPTIARILREYSDLRVAIHNHGPGDDNFPSPMDAYRAVKSFDARMGLCVDVGHTFRWAENPVAALKAVQSRLYDVHLKDFAEASARAVTVPVGRGLVDIPAILRTLVEQKYAYQVALEWEGEAENPVPGMAESFGFVRGVLSG